MKDLKNRVAVVQLLEPQTTSDTDTVSAILDTDSFHGAMIVLNIGAITGVDGSNYLTPILEESDTLAGTDFDTVAVGDVQGAFTKIDATSEDQLAQVVGYIGSKRYIRVNLDYTGTAISTSYVGVTGILGRPEVLPAKAVAALAAT